MAPPFGDIFFRLPPSTAALLLSAVFGLTNGSALPRQTKTVGYHELDVIPFHPAPTAAPWFPFELFRREDNTICGYIGGNSALPATCSSGSHCVLDAANSVVGCCPNGGACTTGVFTGCVDWNSDPQTEINPYVFTCQGTDVCYKNNFAGGYFQFGCGTASDLGTTVETSASGASTALNIATTSMSLTASATTLSTPTTIGSSPSSTQASSTNNRSTETDSSKTGSASASTISPSPTSTPTSESPTSSAPTTITTTTTPSRTSSDTTTSSNSNSSSSKSSETNTSLTTSKTVSKSSSSNTRKTSTTWTTVTQSSSTSSETDSSPSTTSTDDDPPSSQTASPSATPTEGAGSIKKNQTGAIVGGVVGGAAGLIILIALVFFCLRRRQNRNRRTGPGPAPKAPPMTQYNSPMQSHGAAFAPLPSWNEDENPDNYDGDSHLQPPNPYGPLEPSFSAQAPRRSFSGPGRLAPPAPANLSPNAHGGYSQPLRYNPMYNMAGGLGTVAGGGLPPVVEEDQQSSEREELPGRQQYQAEPEPQRSEIDDFSRAYSNARIGQLTDDDEDDANGVEGDRAPLRANAQYYYSNNDNNGGSSSSSNPQYEYDDDDGYPPRRSGGHRPLWQQNRQQSRNLMWL